MCLRRNPRSAGWEGEKRRLGKSKRGPGLEEGDLEGQKNEIKMFYLSFHFSYNKLEPIPYPERF